VELHPDTIDDQTDMRPEQWIPEHLPRLRRYARVLARGDHMRAEDLVQDCLERALSRLHLWREGSDRRAWLFTIMHNLHVNDVRRHARSPETAVFEEPELPSYPRSDGEGQVFLKQLSRFMNQLPPEQREVLYLVAVEGLRYREVATLLGIPEGTVMSRLSRARDALRERLQAPTGTHLRRIK
jgi:RNA polymerase sigma-70 factor (ECF subfamily)